MSRHPDQGRTRVRIARHNTRLACGCDISAGDLVVSYSRNRWTCISHTNARVRVAGQAPRRGAATISQVLADEARR
jgi:hypothetical protein